MSYLSDWREWEERAVAAYTAHPLCTDSLYCPAPNDGHLVGCPHNRLRLGLTPDVLIELWFGVEVRS